MLKILSVADLLLLFAKLSFPYQMQYVVGRFKKVTKR